MFSFFIFWGGFLGFFYPDVPNLNKTIKGLHVWIKSVTLDEKLSKNNARVKRGIIRLVYHNIISSSLCVIVDFFFPSLCVCVCVVALWDASWGQRHRKPFRISSPWGSGLAMLVSHAHTHTHTGTQTNTQYTFVSPLSLNRKCHMLHNLLHGTNKPNILWKKKRREGWIRRMGRAERSGWGWESSGRYICAFRFISSLKRIVSFSRFNTETWKTEAIKPCFCH